MMGIFPGGATDAVTAVTYGGQAMTRAHIRSYNGSTINTEYVMLYYLASPPTGANTVSLTFSGSQPNAAAGAVSDKGTATANAAAGAVSYKGTATSSAAIDFIGGTSNVSTTINPSTTVVKSGCWVVGVSRMSAGSYSGISGGVNRGGYNGGGVTFFDTNGTVGTGAQAPVTVSNSASGSNVAVIASIALPAAGPASVKTANGLAKASVKTVNGLAIASVKSVNGLT